MFAAADASGSSSSASRSRVQRKPAALGVVPTRAEEGPDLEPNESSTCSGEAGPKKSASPGLAAHTSARSGALRSTSARAKARSGNTAELDRGGREVTLVVHAQLQARGSWRGFEPAFRPVRRRRGPQRSLGAACVEILARQLRGARTADRGQPRQQWVRA